ncbi:MAG: UDP-N-acetylmuramoyl-tripeptide--D-alanyl-D-alanine ligase [bacterium]|nr:UDP-N-acetylmuramoyl-tripeptide--D-alanyl-D-alanine ligase [bacterium]
MILLNSIGWSALLLGYLAAAWSVNKRFLQFFQQEEYDSRRFFAWWLRTQSFERRATLLSLAFVPVSLYVLPESYFLFAASGVLFALLIAAAGLSNRPRGAKKPLVMTSRARRIYFTALAVQFALLYWISSTLPGYFNAYCTLPYLPVTLFLIACWFILIPLWIVLANAILSPYESYTQNVLIREARAILRDFNPVVIGMTGSYGKTSIKHILNHILNAYAPAIATPGSVNTRMGITRIIRERLKRDHQFFLVEMGAYGIGSIDRLCRFTPPRVGLVTAVGWAHYERFKSLEAVFHAKSELPRSVPEDGFVVLNGDDPYCRRMAEVTGATAYFYGQNPDAGPLHCRLSEIELTPAGTRCVFETEAGRHECVMPIFGEHQAMNAAGAYLAALQLGVPALTAVAALQTMPQIEHRLTVNKDASGVTIVDDAYNSNPSGFACALRTLRVVEGQRKILVTPGMVELGAREAQEHEVLAPLIADTCDIVCLIAPDRVPAFPEALRRAGLGERLHEFESLARAREFLNAELRAGDVILYENDLPDLYEETCAFH